ncbi:MAG: zinc ribbon domain-containing protein [Alphaproteobacteria bacterium]|nr:zinc ribbon domain-containing protein [Alphaproteobacteria bacterium]
MPVCAYCNTPLETGARTCSQCGAPRTAKSAAVPPPPPGFTLYADAWSGFSVHRPEGWVALPGADGVRFTCGASVLGIGRLPPHATATARDHVQALLQGLPPGHVVPLRDEPRAATVRVDGAPWSGHVQVRVGDQGGLYVLGHTDDVALDIHAVCNALLASLAPIERAARAPFVEPHEGSFQLLQPAGWVVHHTFATPNGARSPWCRAVADPSGRTFVACEVDTLATFLDRPLDPPAPQGFFASLGRMAEQAFAGAPRMPFQGLAPVIEHHYAPRWIQAIPGSELVGIEPLSPTGAYARMALPDGILRVVKVEGTRMPQLGPEHWGAVMAHFYQAPADDMPRLEPVLRGVARSFQVNPQWFRAESARVAQQHAMQMQMHQQQMQMSQRLHQQRMHDIQSAGAASNAMFQAQQEISDMQMQGWRDRNGMSDHGHHQAINAIRGTADYVAPSGEVFNTTDVDRLYRNGQGDFVGGGSAFEPGMDWEELKKL